jgi:hypothetical protein
MLPFIIDIIEIYCGMVVEEVACHVLRVLGIGALVAAIPMPLLSLGWE